MQLCLSIPIPEHELRLPGRSDGHSHSYGRQETADISSSAGYLDYLFGSRMMGAFGISDRISQWPENVRAAAQRAVRAYKRARPLLQGDVHHILPQPLLITPPLSEPKQWEALEYHDATADKAVVYCFRALGPEDSRALPIRGLSPQHSYTVTFENNGAVPRIRGGASVTVRLPQHNTSEILWIERA